MVQPAGEGPGLLLLRPSGAGTTIFLLLRWLRLCKRSWRGKYGLQALFRVSLRVMAGGSSPPQIDHIKPAMTSSQERN